MNKRVCHFGIYRPQYIRNAVLRKGFEAHGYEVVQVHVDPSVGYFKKFWRLYKQYKALPNKAFDYFIVGYPGAPVVWLAYLLHGRSIIYDAFMSNYDSNVLDRKLYSLWSPLGLRDWFYDWYACKLARKVLLPEDVHVDFFVETFGIPRKKYIRVYTGANSDVFEPKEVPKLHTFTAHFHGNFIPLQGIEYIIDAANILKDENVDFQIVGDGGKLFDDMKKKTNDLNLSNVHFVGRKPLEEVPTYIAQSHVCLGVFGSTPKTQRVISNKIYECLAMGMPVVTARTPATSELLEDRKHALLVNVKDGADIAEKIRDLKSDTALRDLLGQHARKLFESSLTPKKLVEGLLEDLSR